MGNYYVSKLVYGSEEPRWVISNKNRMGFVAEADSEAAAKQTVDELNKEQEAKKA